MYSTSFYNPFPITPSLTEHHKYISVCLWRECSDKPVLVGYANISLTDVVLQCVSTASNTHHVSM